MEFRFASVMPTIRHQPVYTIKFYIFYNEALQEK